MPLPPALAARLAKRGIISKKTAQKQQEEEVFAENYDDSENQNEKINLNSEPLERIKFMGYPCCPNKWNVYHECSLWCQNHYAKRDHF